MRMEKEAGATFHGAFTALASAGNFGRLNCGSMSTFQVLQGKGWHAWAAEMG